MTQPFRYTPEMFEIQSITSGTLLIRWPSAHRPAFASPVPWDGKWIIARQNGSMTDLHTAEVGVTDPVADATLYSTVPNYPVGDIVDYLVEVGNEWLTRNWIRRQFAQSDVNPVDLNTIMRALVAQIYDESMRLTGIDETWSEATSEWDLLRTIMNRGLWR